MQTDPIFYTDDMDIYSYAGNDPMDGRDPSGLKNCPDNDKNCVETAESAQQSGDPADKSDKTKQLEEVVVTAHEKKKDSKGKTIRFDDGKEHPYIVTTSLEQARLRTIKEVDCGNGLTAQVNGVSAPSGSTIGHTHPDSFGAPGSVPGPQDGGAARSSGANTAFVMTSRNVFTIEAFPNGTFRTTVTGEGLNASQRAELMAHMQNPGSNASGATDQQRYCGK